MAEATLRQKLAAAIERQQTELARIQTTFTEQTAATRQRLTQLQAAEAALTPQIEALIAGLAQVGVTLTFKEQ